MLVNWLVVGICCLVGEGVGVMIQEMLNGWRHLGCRMSEGLRRSASLIRINQNMNSRKH